MSQCSGLRETSGEAEKNWGGKMWNDLVEQRNQTQLDVGMSSLTGCLYIVNYEFCYTDTESLSLHESVQLLLGTLCHLI